MPAPDLESFKVATSEVSSANKFNSLVQAIEDEFSDIDPDQISGYPSSVAAYLRGDGAWAGAFTTYVPVWSSSGTQPAIGNGTITGRYLQIGKLVYFIVSVTMGGPTPSGTGSYFISVPADISASAPRPTVAVQAFDSSASQTFIGGAIKQTTTTIDPVTLASPVVSFAPTVPFTWATTDTLVLSGTYEAA